MKPEKIVVVEDEADILEVIEYNLVREGYKVFTSTDGEQALDIIKNECPDLVLLDLMLPGMDGIEICRRLRQDADTRSIPVVMVTAKGDESDVVLGLGIGADDYVRKPFSPKELIARVKAVLRRGRPREDETAGERIVRDGVTIDPIRHKVIVDGEEAAFTAKEFKLLHFLAAHPGRVYSRDDLVQRIIGEDSEAVSKNIMDVHIKTVRKKLGAYRELIETVHGVGYRFRE